MAEAETGVPARAATLRPANDAGKADRRGGTLPGLLAENARRFADRPAIREKRRGVWRTWTWAEVRAEVLALAGGFAARGVEKGDRVALMGGNRPAFYWSIAAAQHLGAVPVIALRDLGADELRAVLSDPRVVFGVVESPEYGERLVAADAAERLRGIACIESRGRFSPSLSLLDDLSAEGRAWNGTRPGAVEAAAGEIRPDETAAVLFKSGGSGRPRGVELTHRNLLASAGAVAAVEGLDETEELVAFLPPASIGDHVLSAVLTALTGCCVSCPESPATVMTDLREIGPSVLWAPPRFYERLMREIRVRSEGAGWPRGPLIQGALAAARAGGARRDGFGRALRNVAVYGPLRNVVGLTEIKVAYAAGDAIAPEVVGFYRAIGVDLKPVYGTTEAGLVVASPRDEEPRPGAVGRPVPNVEISVAESGEILVRGPSVAAGGGEPAPDRAPDGWLRTGDLGYFNENGHLHVLGSRRDVGRLSTGALFAPGLIECRLRALPYLRDAVTVGDGRPFAAAIVTIDRDTVGAWAARNGVSFATPEELAERPEVYGLVTRAIAEVNAELAAEPQLADAQIERFLILQRPFSVENGDLTPTGKTRHAAVKERYAPLIEAFYDGRTTVEVDIPVVSETGHPSTARAALRIGDAARSGAPAAAALRMAG